MGGDAYYYIVDYEENFHAALEKLRRSVFLKGEFYGADRNPKTPAEALENAQEEGTKSILDILQISDSPDYCCATPLTHQEKLDYFQSEFPSVEILDKLHEYNDFWLNINRGMAKIAVFYEGTIPKKLLFAGYSFD